MIRAATNTIFNTSEGFRNLLCHLQLSKCLGVLKMLVVSILSYSSIYSSHYSWWHIIVLSIISHYHTHAHHSLPFLIHNQHIIILLSSHNSSLIQFTITSLPYLLLSHFHTYQSYLPHSIYQHIIVSHYTSPHITLAFSLPLSSFLSSLTLTTCHFTTSSAERAMLSCAKLAERWCGVL